MLTTARFVAGGPGSRRCLLTLTLALALAGLSVLGVGCAEGESAASERRTTSSPDLPAGDDVNDEAIPVAAVPLRTGHIEAVLRYSTNLEAESEVEVYAQAARRVTELRVEEGDAVRRGQVLLRLEDEEQRSALEKVEVELRKARRELERQRHLYDQELISEQAFSDATYQVEQLEIALDDARRRLGYTVVEAPIAGVVTRRLVNLGDHVTENQHLFDVVDFDSLVARVYVPEGELPRIAVGQEARILSQALGRELEATIKRIAPTVDPKSGTVKVTLGIPPGSPLRPGLYVEVELVTEVDESAVLVPKRSLVYDQDQVFVFRVDGQNRATRLLVRPLVEDRDAVKVEEGRLAAGDLVVIAGQAGLKDGARVRVLDQREALEIFADELRARTSTPSSSPTI